MAAPASFVIMLIIMMCIRACRLVPRPLGEPSVAERKSIRWSLASSVLGGRARPSPGGMKAGQTGTAGRLQNMKSSRCSTTHSSFITPILFISYVNEDGCCNS